MFRDMRRKKQALTLEENIEILQRGTSGVLALLGDEDYPYAVPLNYVYHDNKIYFHCAKSGHKLDAVRKHGKASFCIIDHEQLVPEEYTTYFKSVIAFGKIRIMEDEKEMRKAIEMLAVKYSPTPKDDKAAEREINGAWDRLCMLELTIEHVSGKQAIELVK